MLSRRDMLGQKNRLHKALQTARGLGVLHHLCPVDGGRDGVGGGAGLAGQQRCDLV